MVGKDASRPCPKRVSSPHANPVLAYQQGPPSGPTTAQCRNKRAQDNNAQSWSIVFPDNDDELKADHAAFAWQETLKDQPGKKKRKLKHPV
ncbi:hypothetical protein DPSP01_002263 [Paraphaeosphaeria sporulosa]